MSHNIAVVDMKHHGSVLARCSKKHEASLCNRCSKDCVWLRLSRIAGSSRPEKGQRPHHKRLRGSQKPTWNPALGNLVSAVSADRGAETYKGQGARPGKAPFVKTPLVPNFNGRFENDDKGRKRDETTHTQKRKSKKQLVNGRFRRQITVPDWIFLALSLLFVLFHNPCCGPPRPRSLRGTGNGERHHSIYPHANNQRNPSNHSEE